MEALRGGESPKTVMLRNMRHYFRLAEKLEEKQEPELEKWFSENPNASVQDKVRAVLSHCQKTFDLRDRAQKCAVALAPYFHPTLAAIHHMGEVEVRNVVRVPDTAESVEQWLKGTPGELRPSTPIADINSAKNP
jgi:hypothetical protein